MRHAQAVLISTGVSVAGLLVAGCGTIHQAAGRATTSTHAAAGSAGGTRTASVSAPARICFISPRGDARVGPTLRVHVRVSHRGRVRFILDTGRPRLRDVTTVVYRGLTPGLHRLEAQLLVAPGQPPAATAIVRFRVRRSAPKAAVLAPVPPPPTTAAPAPPPAPPQTTTATPPPPTSTAPAAPPASTGIPQGGGGDGDGDNSGAPSDGDGGI